MAPNMEEFASNSQCKATTSVIPTGPVLILTPLPTIIRYQEREIVPTQFNTLDTPQRIDVVKVNLPLEQNLWELLKRVMNTEDLESLTQVKLRVITREVPLQYLSIYTPALRELILDGSFVSTLRDLGCGLKNLKILKVNRCNLYYLDGMFSFEGLEELHAADNYISNIIPCAFLPNLKVLDLRRNRLKNFSALNCLSICEALQHLNLEGNNEISQFSNYRQHLKILLPGLKSLDGITFDKDIASGGHPPPLSDCINTVQEPCGKITERNKSVMSLLNGVNGGKSPSRNRPSTPINTSFTVTFPPRVFTERVTNLNNEAKPIRAQR